MKKLLKKHYKWLLVPLLAVAVGAIGEVLYNLPVTQQGDYQYLEADQIKTKGFKVKEGVYLSQVKGGELDLYFEKQYVDKLYYQFEFEGQLHNHIVVDAYVTDVTTKKVEIDDHNNHIWKASMINIRETTDHIKIKMPKDAQNILIRAVAINNTTNYSAGRFLFHCLCVVLFFFVLAIIKGPFEWKAEWIFLMVAASVGGLLIFTLPSHKVGLDEEIHFGRAYYLFDTIKGSETITVTPHMNELITTGMANWPYSTAQSEEEEKLEKNFWNENLKYDSAKPSSEDQMNGYGFQLYSFSYLPQTLMIKAGQLMHLDFTTIYALGRLGNLILYCLVVFFAIRHIVVGKRIMMVLALMPTAVFSASTYSYDAFVTAFAFLGISYLVTELAEERKLSYRNCLIFGAAFILASFPKPVYIPMILPALFFPASKFKSKKEQYLFKGIIAGTFLLMFATFALPPLLNPQQAGDARGGDTGIGRQIRYVFAHPLIYTKLLLSSIAKSFWSFTLGSEGLGRMGHLKMLPTGIPIALIVGATTLTDQRDEDGYQIKTGHKAVMVLCFFAVICLIWTALYLSFTPVGAAQIEGVQGRYYLPVTMFLFLSLRLNDVKVFVKKRADYAVITAGCAILLLYSIFQSVIVNTF